MQGIKMIKEAEFNSLFLPLVSAGFLFTYTLLHILVNQEPSMSMNDVMIAMVMPWSTQAGWAQMLVFWLLLLFQDPKRHYTRMILDGMSGVKAVINWQSSAIRLVAAHSWLLPLLAVLTPFYYQEQWEAFSINVLVLALARWFQYIFIGWILFTFYYVLAQRIDKYLVWVSVFLIFMLDHYLYPSLKESVSILNQQLSRFCISYHLQNLPTHHDSMTWTILILVTLGSIMVLTKYFKIQGLVGLLSALRPQIAVLLTFALIISLGPKYDLLPFSTQANEPLLVNFWATWCRPCMLELNELGEQANRYPTKYAMLINTQADSISRHVLRERGIDKQTNIIVKTNAALGGTLSLYLKLVSGQTEAAYPTTLFVQDGLVNAVQVGYVPNGSLAYDEWFKQKSY